MKVGDYLKVIFTNNCQLEGFLERIEEDTLFLTAKTDGTELIVFNYQKNVLFIKVESMHHTQISLNKTNEEPNFLNEKINELEESVENDYNDETQEFNLNLHNKKLAELHLLKVKQEKEIIANKLKDHSITGINTYRNNYNHGLFKK